LKVHLLCGEERSRYFADVLGEDLGLEIHGMSSDFRASPGDVVLFDLAEHPGDWKRDAAALKGSLREGVKVLGVLRYEQVRKLGAGDPLDDFALDGSTGEELRARVRRMLGTERPRDGREGGLVIDEDRYEVRVDGSPVELTYKEFELLRFLASRPGKVFTREVLLEQVWGYDYFGGSRTVDVHVRRIRAKIEREGRTYIRTVRGVGYIFEAAENT
jgi:hypothetical protein